MAFDYKRNKQDKYIVRNGQKIIIKKLDHILVVNFFIEVLNDAITKRGYKELFLDFSNVSAIFPNAITPIVGIINYYINYQNISFKVVGRMPSKYLKKILRPIPYTTESGNILDYVWEFHNSEEVSRIVDAFKEELLKCDTFPKGVITSLEWSLNEVMDNVIQHSLVEKGFVMGQLQKNNKLVAFSVFDYGQGIYNSFKNSKHAPKTHVDAITEAIKEEVTRDNRIGQGNGLYGLHSIVKQGKGRLTIVSGKGRYSINMGQTDTFDRVPVISYDNPGTIVDFQLSYSSDLSLDNALVFRGKQYPLVNIWLDKMEDDMGRIVYYLKDHAEGTGTRQAAIRVKNEIYNIFNEKVRTVILDFDGIEVISSSFADELLAKLFIEMGMFQFNNMIQIRGLDATQQRILHRSVLQRLMDEMKSTTEKSEQNTDNEAFNQQA